MNNSRQYNVLTNNARNLLSQLQASEKRLNEVKSEAAKLGVSVADTATEAEYLAALAKASAEREFELRKQEALQSIDSQVTGHFTPVVPTTLVGRTLTKIASFVG